MSLTQALHRGVQQNPHHLYSVHGTRAFTYEQVAQRVSRIAGGLSNLGLAPEDRVAILALNSDDYLHCLLAIAWADGICVPVNTRWSQPEIIASLEEAEVSMLIVDDTFAGMAPNIAEAVPSLTRVLHAGQEEPGPGFAARISDLAERSQQIADAHRGGDSTLGLFYTGGTTGQSRGAVLSHQALDATALAFAAALPLDADAVYLVSAPLFHLAQFSGWVASTQFGATQVVLPSFDPEEVMRLIQEHRVTRAVLVPTMLHAIVHHPAAAQYDLSSLDTVIYGGSPISQATLEQARKLLPGAGFLQVYGMTEMSAVATILAPADHHDPRLTTSAGRAALHTRIEIVDPDTHAPVPCGTVGEIRVRGYGMMGGYWKRDTETTAVISEDGWLSTGDAGHLDERGYLFVVDRVKDMIISGGENVYSAEVENVIARHPAVAQCAVIALPHDQWVETVHAVVVLAPGASLDLADLQAHCRPHLAGYKCPRGLTLLDSLPVSGAGKILKRRLRDDLTSSNLRTTGETSR
ncbi:class I adenylate-forming enzyme family protein [Streptomyces xiangluensis]|uniref:Class I adenylate-forming enzyme family protein n=1 Tax=Streptomyces xiangluensis TaxID=2665720 RepID=A0ABV8YX71_9ACTN